MGNSCLRRVGCLEAVGLSQGFQLYDDRIPEPDENSPARGHADRPAGEVVDLAIRWLSGQDDKRPFFVWVHLYDPTALINRPHLLGKNSASDPTTEKLHTPTARSENFWQRAEKGLLGNTILAVLSDHGESLGQHGESSHGVFLYDATLRIPFILVGPGIPAGKRVLDQARTIDLLPTILEFLVGDPPKTCQGVSLLPTFLGKKVETDYAYAEALFPKINMG